MKLPYRITDAANMIYRAGVSYHAYGTITQDKVALFNYYKCDKLTAKQEQELKAFCPDMLVRASSPAYAPEQRNIVLLFPKSAWYRQQAAA